MNTSLSMEDLKEEGNFFFGGMKTTRAKTVKTKLDEFVQRESSMRKTLGFQIMRAVGGLGARGRNPPLNFRLHDVTLNGFISVHSGESESDFNFKCEICGTMLFGRENCEKHLREEHYKEFKSLFAKECFAKIENHVKYKQWEAEQIHIDGLTFFNEEDKEKHTLKQKENKKGESPGETDSGETFKLVRERSSGPNIFEAERTVLTLNQEGGEPKKAVIRDVYAKITTRQVLKRANDNRHDDTAAKKHKMSSRGLRYHATNVNNILGHVSAHDKETQAVLVAKLLDCLEDLPERRERYARALSTLAKVSDALKTDFDDDFDDEDLAAIQGWCEEWGENWQKDFGKNLTPKAHDLIFVIPEFIKQHKTFSMFYKAEQAGESIHAILNDINRKL